MHRLCADMMYIVHEYEWGTTIRRIDFWAAYNMAREFGGRWNEWVFELGAYDSPRSASMRHMGALPSQLPAYMSFTAILSTDGHMNDLTKKAYNLTIGAYGSAAQSSDNIWASNSQLSNILTRWAYVFTKWAYVFTRWAYVLTRWAYVFTRWAYVLT